MTTQINVRVTGGGVVGQNKRDAEANRQSLRNREEQAVTISGAQRGIIQVNGQTVSAPPGKARRSEYVKEKPAANRFDDIPLGHVWHDYWRAYGDTATTDDGSFANGVTDVGNYWAMLEYAVTVESVDEGFIKDIVTSRSNAVTSVRSSSLDRAVSAPIRPRFLALPVTSTSFILICMGYRLGYNEESSLIVYQERIPDYGPWTEAQFREYVEDGGNVQTRYSAFTNTSFKERYFNAYICTNTSVREIGVPEAMQPILDLLNPEPLADELSVVVHPNPPYNNPNFTVSYTRYYAPIGDGIVPRLGGEDCDPGIFISLYNFAIDNDLTPPYSLPSIDRRRFFFNDEARLVYDTSDPEWLFAYLTGPTIDEEQAQSTPRYDYRYAPSITEPPDFEESTPVRRQHTYFTTGGAPPDACINLCLALGFAPSDLTP